MGMETEKKYESVEKDLMATKESAKTIESRMHALDAVMMEKDYSEKILKLDAIILEIPKSDSNIQTEILNKSGSDNLNVSQQTLPNSLVVEVEKGEEKIANDDDSSDSSDTSKSSSSESESSYSDSADDEESVVPNIHISRKPQSKKQTKQIQINSKPQSKKSSKNSLNNLNLLPDINRTKSTNSQSLRRVQTMPVFKAESGFLTKVFTKCAANSKNAYLSIASKTIFGVLALTQENVGLGSVLYNMFWSDNNNNQNHNQRQKTNISNKNARFFNSGVGQETLDDFETRSRMSMNRRVQSMANFENSGQNNFGMEMEIE